MNNAAASETDRERHLSWCKDRATQLVNEGDHSGAVASMVSDLRKHEAFSGEAYGMLALLGMMEIGNGPQAVQRWIDGFN